MAVIVLLSLKKATIVLVSTILIAVALVSGCAPVQGLTAKQGNAALDGHMVVKSDSYSYETYSYKGTEYTRVAGQDWCRSEKGASDPGYGMVTAGARRIIARFSDLVEDVRFTRQTVDEYTVTMLMGKKYYDGARAIAGTGGTHATGSAAAGETRMTLVIGRGDLRMRSVIMTDAKAAGGSTPAVTIVTRGAYSDFNKPVDIRPPAEALRSREVGAEVAPPTRQDQ